MTRPLRAGVAAVLASALLAAGCATPVIVGGMAVGGALVATDRRTTGAQVEDQSIELKAASAISALRNGAHVNATSYNRTVLLTGEVPSEAERQRVEQTVARIDNVRAVVNELAVMGNSSLGSQSNDAYLSGRVKAALVDQTDPLATSVKVVTERGVVHLMGIVTEREAARATEAARSVSGVQKVVRVFEILSDEQVRALQPPPPK